MALYYRFSDKETKQAAELTQVSEECDKFIGREITEENKLLRHAALESVALHGICADRYQAPEAAGGPLTEEALEKYLQEEDPHYTANEQLQRNWEKTKAMCREFLIKRYLFTCWAGHF